MSTRASAICTRASSILTALASYSAVRWELFYSYQQLPTRFQLLQVTMR